MFSSNQLQTIEDSRTAGATRIKSVAGHKNQTWFQVQSSRPVECKTGQLFRALPGIHYQRYWISYDQRDDGHKVESFTQAGSS